MYSLPGYIEKKRSELKIVIKVKNHPIMIRSSIAKKIRFILNSKKIPNRWFTTIEILPINIVIQT